MRYLEIEKYFGFLFHPLDIIYAKAQIGILEKNEVVAKLFRTRFFFRKPTHLQIHRLARFYPLECLNFWLMNGCTDPILLAIAGKYGITLPNDVVKKCLNSTNPDTILLKKRWSGLNCYLYSYGLNQVASSKIWKFKINYGQSSSLALNYKVTVLMTCFNSTKTVESAIESLLNQTFKNIQILIIDDASNDDTYEKLVFLQKKYYKRDIRIFKNEVNCGTYASKLKLVDYVASDTDFITCMDSDDWSHPEKIHRQVQFLLDHPKKVANISYWIRFDEYGIPWSKRIFPYLSLNPSSLMIRKGVIEQLGKLWDSKVRIGADQELILRISEIFGENSIGYLRLPLTFARHREGSLTTAPDTSTETNSGQFLRANYIHRSFFN